MTKGRPTLVTGASGFTGQHLLPQLATDEYFGEVVSVVRTASATDWQTQVLELTDFAAVKTCIHQISPHTVIHLAGTMPPADSGSLWLGNVGITTNLLLSLKTLPHKVRVLIVGSAAEYAGSVKGTLEESDLLAGVSEYGRSKNAQAAVASQLAQHSNLEIVFARPFNLVGPGMSANLFLGSVVAQLRSGSDEIQVGRTDSVRDFVDIRDACNAYRLIVREGIAGEAYNVSTGQGTSIQALLDLAVREFGSNARIVQQQRNAGADVDTSIGHNGKLRALGWTPQLTLQQSLQDMASIK